MKKKRYEVRKADWANKNHPDLVLWGIFQIKGNLSTWHSLITDSKEYADKYLRENFNQ